jgi:hypothetical protein
MKTYQVQAKVTRWSIVKRKIRKAFFLFLGMIVIISSVFIYWKYFYTYSNGYRAGLLQKFSHKGNIIKTFEGEMILSSVTGNMNVTIASEKFYFSVTNHTLAKKLDTIQGQMVIVHYQQKNGVLFWQGDSQYLVDSVKPVRQYSR